MHGIRKGGWLGSPRVIFALVMRDMATTYGNSRLGYFWAILEPVGAISVLALAFSFAFSKPALGESFPLFYATGYIPFMMYNAMQNRVSSAIRENIYLLFYPRVTYMDAIIGRFLLTGLTQIVVASIVVVGILAFSHHNEAIDFAAIGQAYLMALILGLGLGTFNLVVIFLFPSWRQLWSVITRPLFLISCVFYLYDQLPEWMQAVLWYNPIVHLIGKTRQAFYPFYQGEYVSVAFPVCIGGGLFLLALVLLKKFAKDIINY